MFVLPVEGCLHNIPVLVFMSEFTQLLSHKHVLHVEICSHKMAN